MLRERKSVDFLSFDQPFSIRDILIGFQTSVLDSLNSRMSLTRQRDNYIRFAKGGEQINKILNPSHFHGKNCHFPVLIY